MKLTKFLIVLATGVLSFSTCTEDDFASTSGPEGEIPEPMPVGFPIGAPPVKTIGPGGRSISSQDEIMTVEVPAGALNQDTKICIQPIMNFASNGVGKAYQLTAEGIEFNKKVIIIIKHGLEASDVLSHLKRIIL